VSVHAAAAAPKDLKAQNTKSIWAVVVLDAVILAPMLGLQTGTFGLATLLKRGPIAAAAPVLLLLLTLLLTSEAKARLVFWRFRNAMPGHRAFSVYALRDSRIKLDTLRRKLGALPTDPREQNSVWYGLYRKVQDDVAVRQAHRHYLLFRDLVALSIVLVPAAAVIAVLNRVPVAAGASATGLLLLQYVLCAVAARYSGVRVVTNVLAIYAA